ncbi:MAG TPA: glutamate--cysteine ligase [Acidiferrobacterales bacterium]|nr:glutamate--cysteine ligase [Acidiferrobacterales bacterium]
MGIEHLHSVPHLTTALTGPLQQIEERLLQHQADIEQWFRRQWLETPAPLYASVDLRNAGFKLAPVDTNLFPGGFNNLSPAFQPLCVQAIQSAIERFCPKACRVVIVPENHTRNLFYLENLAALEKILKMAGFRVRIGSLLPGLTAPEILSLPDGQTLTLEPLVREGSKVKVADFIPCFVLLNNDLSAGRPAILENLDQPVMPPLALGWSDRRKSDHFAHYHRIVEEFAQLVDLDPWLIDPIFRKCGEIDFHKHEGEECLASNVDTIIAGIREKYQEYGINQEPFVMIKADTGTYGMGVMTAHNGDEVRNLNRKQRNKMAVGKEGQTIHEVMVQEGVYTFETWGNQRAAAEPVVYMIDRFVVGGFYRVHTGRGSDQNLNAPGMYFEPLAFAESCTNPDRNKAPDAHPNRFYAYGVVARLALLAAARELNPH